MFRYVLSRLVLTLPSLLGVLTIAFLLVHLVPGDPVDLLLGERASPADRANLRRELGVDQPLLPQYVSYLTRIARGDLGRSLASGESVADEIARHFPATLELSVVALAMALIWGLPLGVMAAVRPRSMVHPIAEAISLLGMSVPAVFLGPLLIYAFAIGLDWLPVSERDGWDSVLLPAISLALPLGAVITRMTRAAVREVLNEDFIRTARSKGLGDGAVYFKHALRNALVPIVTIVSLQMGALLTGTVITETIFDWPGIGTLLLGAIQRRDYPVVQACVLMVAVIYVLVNLLGDLLYGVVNPRVRLARG